MPICQNGLVNSHFPHFIPFPHSVQYLKVKGVGLELDLCVAAETTS